MSRTRPDPPSRGWLVWNKPERNFTLAEAELAWTSRDMVIRVADLPRSEPGREHPTQKPLSLMHFCLRFFPNARSVIDPFALRSIRDLAADVVRLMRGKA